MRYSVYSFNNVHIDVDVLDCNFKLQNEPSIPKILLFYSCLHSAPVLLALFIVIKGYLKALKSANEIPKALMDQLGFKKYHLLVYPIVLAMAFLPGLVSNITSVYRYPPPFWLLTLEISISHSIGTINAVLYIKLRKLYQIGHPGRYREETAELIDSMPELDSLRSSMLPRRKTSTNGSLFVY